METGRREFLAGMAGAAMMGTAERTEGTSGGGAVKAYVLSAEEGEHLIHFRDGGNLWIKVGKAEGTEKLAQGTQQVKAGGGVPVHRHPEMEETFYVLEGSGVVTLDDVATPIAKGAMVFIPRMTWHGFTTKEQDLVLLWTTLPAGLDQFFRATCSAPGEPAKKLTKEEIRAIAMKYGTEFR